MPSLCSFFQEEDRNIGPSFWSQASQCNSSTESPSSGKLYSGTVFIVDSTNTLARRYLSVSKSTLFCATATDFPPASTKQTCIWWKVLDAFVDESQPSLQFGFRLSGHSQAVCFYVESETELVGWLDVLTTVAINLDLEEDYVFQSELSKGRVYRARHLLTSNSVAVKSLPKTLGTERIVREISLLRRLSHPCIRPLKQVYEGPQSVCLVFDEAVGGTFANYILKKGRLTEEETKELIHALVTVFTYLVTEGVCVSSLRLSEVLLNSPSKPYAIQLCGFGHAYVQEDPTTDVYLRFIERVMETALSGSFTYNRITEALKTAGRIQIPRAATAALGWLRNNSATLPAFLQHPWLVRRSRKYHQSEACTEDAGEEGMICNMPYSLKEAKSLTGLKKQFLSKSRQYSNQVRSQTI